MFGFIVWLLSPEKRRSCEVLERVRRHTIYIVGLKTDDMLRAKADHVGGQMLGKADNKLHPNGDKLLGLKRL